MTSDPIIEELILAPADDEQYAKRMRLLRESFRYQQLKYGRVQQKVAEHRFRIMFKEVSA